MTDDNVLPGNFSIDFDLDAAQRPAEEVQPPFVVNIGGRPVTMRDPGEFDWQDLLDIQNPQDFLRYCLDDDDREHLANTAMPGWKLNLLMDKYMKHYKLDRRVRQAQDEQRRASRGF